MEKLYYKDQYLKEITAEITNIIENNGEFTSTKNDKVLPHGIGIKNVRKVVSNLNGQIDFSYASGYFSVKAELPNYS